MENTKIVPVDWSKVKMIEANYGGMSTDKLLEVRDNFCHIGDAGLCDSIVHEMGGYAIRYTFTDLDQELGLRGISFTDKDFAEEHNLECLLDGK